MRYKNLLVFEGTDGVGKSSISKGVLDKLLSMDVKAVLFREPGSTTHGEDIRNILLKDTEEKLLIKSQVLLFNAARHELVEKQILPKLKEGYIVLLDRFLDSTFVYQGYTQAKEEELNETIAYIDKLHKTTINVDPGFTIRVKSNPDTVKSRLSGREEQNHLDTLALSNLELMNKYYDLVMEMRDGVDTDYLIINNELDNTIEELVEEVVDKLKLTGVIK